MNKEDTIYLQTALGVEADSIIGPITREAYANKLISIASKESGVRETSKNQGPGIKKYWDATWYEDGYADREPWCAAYICFVFQQSKMFREALRPKTPAAFSFEAWGATVGLQVIKHPQSVKKGDIVIFDFSHIALATSDSKLESFHTWEGNTNGAGSREGNGVYYKTRTLGVVRSVIRL